MEKQYTLKIYPKGRGRTVYRTMEICGSNTLDDLCSEILVSLDFSDDHLYEFCMNNSLYGGECYQSCTEDKQRSTRIKIDKLELNEKQKFLLHYDFGDDWMFIITVQKIVSISKYIKTQIIKEKGSVMQYPDWDEEEYD